MVQGDFNTYAVLREAGHRTTGVSEVVVIIDAYPTVTLFYSGRNFDGRLKGSDNNSRSKNRQGDGTRILIVGSPNDCILKRRRFTLEQLSKNNAFQRRLLILSRRQIVYLIE